MATQDKPHVNLTLASLKEETASPEPFVLALDGSKRVTFPDLFDVPVEEAESFLAELNGFGKNDFKFLEKWLTPKDFETYKSAGLNLRTHAAIMARVLDYYEASMGKPGEGDASKR